MFSFPAVRPFRAFFACAASLFAAVALCGTLAASPFPADRAATPGTGTIRVTIKLGDTVIKDKPTAGRTAKVTLHTPASADPTTKASTVVSVPQTVEEDGTFVLSNVPPGEYALMAVGNRNRDAIPGTGKVTVVADKSVAITLSMRLPR